MTKKKVRTELGFDLQAQDAWGYTPLEMAKANGHRDVIELLENLEPL